MTGGISINVSGGSAQFGNVSQGDQSTNDARLAQSVSAPAAFSAFYREVERLAEQARVREEDVAALKRDVASFESTLANKSASKTSIGKIAKSLYENYGWAVEPLKKLFLAIAA